MTSVFLYMFLVGFGLTVISALLGVLHVGDGSHAHGDIGHGHGGGHDVGQTGHGSHGGHGTDHGHGGEQGAEAVSPINFQSLVAFCMGFGGVGFLATRFGITAMLVAVVVAAAGGVGCAWVIYRWLRFLVKGERPLGPTEYVATVGRLSASIRPDGTGEMVYAHHGTRTALAARSADGTAILKGTEVVIVKFEKGIAYVQPMDGLNRTDEN